MSYKVVHNTTLLINEMILFGDTLLNIILNTLPQIAYALAYVLISISVRDKHSETSFCTAAFAAESACSFPVIPI